MDATLMTLFTAYKLARQTYDEAKRRSDEADKYRRACERTLVDYMLEIGVTKFGTDDDMQPIIVKQQSIQVNKENSEQIRQWLLDTVGDDSDYMKTELSKSAVLELVKDRSESGDEIPEFLGFKESPGLRVLGWQK